MAGVSAALLRALAAHPEQMADLMEALHRRVVDEDSLLDLMARASREAVRLIDDAQWAGVTAQFAGAPFTTAHTDDRVLVVDEGQYGQGDGPCLSAMREDRQVAMSAAQVEDRWPRLAEIAAAAGVRSFRAEPLHARQRSVGSLNLYSGRDEGLRTPDPDIVTVLTEYLDRGLTDYSAAQPGEAQAVRLRERLLDRQLVDTAIGVLMATHSISATAATEMLEQQAARQTCTIWQAAANVVAGHRPRSVAEDPTDPHD